MTDKMGRSSIENLYAFGESACTGLHGGNRLASNSLLEAVVFAHQAFIQCKADWPSLKYLDFPTVPEWDTGPAERIEECVLISHNWDQIRRLMWNYVGIVRSDKRLALVKERLAPVLKEVDRLEKSVLPTPKATYKAQQRTASLYPLLVFSSLVFLLLSLYFENVRARCFP